MITPVGALDTGWTVVRRGAYTPAAMAAMATVGLVVALLLAPGYTDLDLRLYAVVIGLLGLRVVLAVISQTRRSSGQWWIDNGHRRPVAQPAQPPQLEDLEHLVTFAQSSAFDYHRRLRQLLEELATDRLATNWNIDPASASQAARWRLGDELWEALYADPATEDREARGPSLATLRRLIERLEAL